MLKDKIQKRLDECAISADQNAAQKLAIYHTLLLDWNTRMDLTAVLDEDEMIDRHYIDSLMVLTMDSMLNGKSMIDVGTGAGFPGMPLAIARPDLQVTLLDAQQKRLNFLQAVIDELHLTNVTLIHARAEDGARMKNLRESFDHAVARAVAPLPVLEEYLLPFVKTGGSAICWKGPALAAEREQGRKAAFLLGGKLADPVDVHIPGRNDWHHVLQVISKVAGTPKIYPRKAGTPTKSPLG